LVWSGEVAEALVEYGIAELDKAGYQLSIED
jgi:hypothetical protein